MFISFFFSLYSVSSTTHIKIALLLALSKVSNRPAFDEANYSLFQSSVSVETSLKINFLVPVSDLWTCWKGNLGKGKSKFAACLRSVLKRFYLDSIKYSPPLSTAPLVDMAHTERTVATMIM